jgi:hypothetical protein
VNHEGRLAPITLPPDPSLARADGATRGAASLDRPDIGPSRPNGRAVAGRCYSANGEPVKRKAGPSHRDRDHVIVSSSPLRGSGPRCSELATCCAGRTANAIAWSSSASVAARPSRCGVPGVPRPLFEACSRCHRGKCTGTPGRMGRPRRGVPPRAHEQAETDLTRRLRRGTLARFVSGVQDGESRWSRWNGLHAGHDPTSRCSSGQASGAILPMRSTRGHATMKIPLHCHCRDRRVISTSPADAQSLSRCVRCERPRLLTQGGPPTASRASNRHRRTWQPERRRRRSASTFRPTKAPWRLAWVKQRGHGRLLQSGRPGVPPRCPDVSGDTAHQGHLHHLFG